MNHEFLNLSKPELVYMFTRLISLRKKFTFHPSYLNDSYALLVNDISHKSIQKFYDELSKIDINSESALVDFYIKKFTDKSKKKKVNRHLL